MYQHYFGKSISSNDMVKGMFSHHLRIQANSFAGSRKTGKDSYIPCPIIAHKFRDIYKDSSHTNLENNLV